MERFKVRMVNGEFHGKPMSSIPSSHINFHVTGKGSERLTTSQLTVLYGLQCGEEIDMESLYTEIKTFLLSAVNDGSADVAQRAKIIFKLAVLCFLCSGKFLRTLEISFLSQIVWTNENILESHGDDTVLLF